MGLILSPKEYLVFLGQPQYIRRGAIKNLMDATTIVHKPKASGNGVVS